MKNKGTCHLLGILLCEMEVFRVMMCIIHICALVCCVRPPVQLLSCVTPMQLPHLDPVVCAISASDTWSLLLLGHSHTDL